jgi:TolA-binding protein
VSYDSPDSAHLDSKRVAELVAAEAGAFTSTTSDANHFVRYLAEFRRVRRRGKRIAAGAVVMVTIIGVGVTASRFRTSDPTADLSYRVDDHTPPSGGYVSTTRTAQSLLTFSDGSKVRMAARSRGRVVQLTDRGARFSLEEGKASVDIVPHPRARWLFEAGPFLVTVHGTSFTVAWNPVDALFEVRLENGAISVASPLAGPEIQLRTGQTLRVSLRDQTSTIQATASTDVPPAVGAPATAPSRPSPWPDAAVAPKSGPISEPGRWSHRGWTAALKENRSADVVADADRTGLATVLERADSEDLWALANAARYAGRYSLANQALMAQRSRFPTSEGARNAAFLLGRLHDDDRDGPDAALGWYDRYLADTRDGIHASDALGRKMTLLERWNRHAESLTAAKEYLRRFPEGFYANAARALLRSSEHRQ